MNKKELEKPLKVRKLEALLPRLQESHPKYEAISDELGRRMSGYRGEQSLTYYLSFLKDKYYLIFHNLRLPDTSGEHFFEIDILLICPSFILLIDAKNYRGELHFDSMFEQFIQTYEDKKKAYPCPIAQMNWHHTQLKRLLESHKFPLIPIETLVIFTNPSAIITASHGHKQIHRLIKGTSFLSKIELMEKRHKKEAFDKKQIQKVTKVLMKSHTPYDGDILKEFDIRPEELRKGVRCPTCGKFPMVRSQRMWCCTSCNTSTKMAYHNAIIDYSLLIGNTITNQQLRNFLGLESRSASKNILKTLQLEHRGTLRHRVYKIPEFHKL
ncbi:nuclease-related domain-containing protein [Fredinandcohnia humi]